MTRRNLDCRDGFVGSDVNVYNETMTVRTTERKGKTEYVVTINLPVWKARNLIRELRANLRRIRYHKITTLNHEVELAEGPL